MANSLIGRLDRTFRQLLVETIAGAAAAVALFFFSLAAFDLISQRYNAIVASMVLGGVYLILALAALIWARSVSKREEAGQNAPVGAAQLLQDPVVISTGLEILRALGSRRATPFAALLLVGVLVASRFNSKQKSSGSGSEAGS
jgi:arginine exporter protein ArgO